LESILEYPSQFDGLTLELLQCKVVIPLFLLVMLFLWAIHSCYADIVKQFCSQFKAIETATVNSILSNVAFQDSFTIVNSKKGKSAGGSGFNLRAPAVATANTDHQGQVWQSPFEWLTKYGLKGIKGCWMRAMAGTGICSICVDCSKSAVADKRLFLALMAIGKKVRVLSG
jgi:hypothetical protein